MSKNKMAREDSFEWVYQNDGLQIYWNHLRGKYLLFTKGNPVCAIDVAAWDLMMKQMGVYVDMPIIKGDIHNRSLAMKVKMFQDNREMHRNLVERLTEENEDENTISSQDFLMMKEALVIVYVMNAVIDDENDVSKE